MAREERHKVVTQYSKELLIELKDQGIIFIFIRSNVLWNRRQNIYEP